MDQSVDSRLLANQSNHSNLETNGNLRGSCPDLSDDQLRMWDDILYKAIQNERDALQNKEEALNKFRRKTFDPTPQRARSNTPMTTSIYEICAPVDVEGNEETDNVLNGLDENCDENGNISQPTTSLDEAFDLRSNSSSSKENDSQRNSDSLAKKLRKELEDLQFRNTCEWQTSTGKVMKINANPLFDMEADFPQNRQKSVEHRRGSYGSEGYGNYSTNSHHDGNYGRDGYSHRNNASHRNSDGQSYISSTGTSSNNGSNGTSTYEKSSGLYQNQKDQYQSENYTSFPNPQHMTTYDAQKHPFFTTSLYLPNTKSSVEKCSFEEDYFEGMNIRVNPFEESDDIALEEADCPPATRFQQLQWAIQRQKERYNDQLQMPEKACCSIM
ncbi:unnamed protein product [Bursaphelenchus okinawaensis]|uniref:Uncharacterized protein n=1 Tax=Bursaphelenchus okinawaensis TaxID=465554 RepID=A0A811L3A1_9BILA|nr:unnamed protein product [Bursaphelenchus okinawaensis]CAG9115240.1 unnamed protein product [Bursaphelenchus okinawaensis]